MFLHQWASCYCFCSNIFCRGNCRYVSIGENKHIPHSLLSLFNSFTRLIILRRILCCSCFAAGPILFPFPNQVFLEFKVSLYQPDHKFPIVSSALLMPWNNASPWILNLLTLPRTQRRLMSPQPVHVFKKVRQTSKAVKWQTHCLSPTLGLPLLYKLSHIFPVVNLKPVRWCTIGLSCWYIKPGRQVSLHLFALPWTLTN